MLDPSADLDLLRQLLRTVEDDPTPILWIDETDCGFIGHVRLRFGRETHRGPRGVLLPRNVAEYILAACHALPALLDQKDPP